MKQITECFATTPIVYAVRGNYQIIVPVTRETLMWVEVGGKCFYDDVNGILRSNCTTHKMTVPMERLDAAGAYPATQLFITFPTTVMTPLTVEALQQHGRPLER